jgi:hypothetical protein
MLWAPSWGGMLNGLLTLRGAWDKLRTDPVIKFFAAGVTFYGMATFEGPLLSIRAVNALSHYTDWTIGHVHSGALGWNGFMAAGMFYWLAPRLWKTKLWSKAWPTCTSGSAWSASCSTSPRRHVGLNQVRHHPGPHAQHVSEGCYNCHSQMIRTLVPEVMRYGRAGVADDYSHLGESLFDHPFQWGSKRTGPDLAREGGPIALAGALHTCASANAATTGTSTTSSIHARSPGSNMPAYPGSPRRRPM